MPLSNKTLVYLISIAILITLFNTTYNLNKLQKEAITGLVGGPVNVTIASTVSINLSKDVINWGSGRVQQDRPNATIDTGNGTAYVKGGTWSASGINRFLLQNVGNVPVNVTINSTQNASSYIGGTGPAFAFMMGIAAGNSTACESQYTATSGQRDFNPTGNASQKVVLCHVFNHTLNRDHLTIDINITIPDDASTGSKNTTINFDACDVSTSSCSP